MSDKNIRYGQARVQFIALMSEVKELFEKGYTAQNLYDEFRKSGKITMSYRTFSRYIRTMVKKITQKSKIIKAEETVQENKNEKQEISVKKFSAQKKKKGFGSGLHKDADEVC